MGEKSIIEKLGITPGPWNSKHRRNGHFDDEGDELYSTQVFSLINEKDSIATVMWCGVKTKSGYESRRDEHAKLIAAAPEMLEALIEIANGCEIVSRFKAQNIIEKATGKTWEQIKELL